MMQESRRTFLSLLVLSTLLLVSPSAVRADSVIASIGVGDGPLAIAYAPSSDQIFVANHLANTVSVISDRTNTVVKNISLGSAMYPEGLAFDSGRNEMFVTANGNSEATPEIYIISVANDSIVGNITIPASSANMAYDSSKGEVFVASPASSSQAEQGGPLIMQGNSTIQVISDSTDSVIATVSLGEVPSNLTYGSGKGDQPIPGSMVFDSARGEVFVSNEVYNFSDGAKVASTVSVISDETNKLLATIDIGGGTNPQGLAYDSSKGEIFAANSNGTDVFVISDVTDSVVAKIRVEAESTGHEQGTNGVLGVAYDQSKGEVLVANEWNYIPNTVSVISDVNDSVVAKLDVGYGPSGLAYDSGRGEVFVANTGDNTVSIISDTVAAPEFPGYWVLPALLAIVLGASVWVYTLSKRPRGLLPNSTRFRFT